MNSSAPTLPPGLEVYRPSLLLGTAVLVVDDEAPMRAQLEMDLTGLGYRYVGARTAEEAREALQGGRFGGVLLDIALGESEEAGYDLLTWIRQRNTSLPVVVLSATQVSSAAIRRAYELGASSYFVKGDAPLAHIYSDLAARMLEGASARAALYRFGDLEFDASGRTLKLEGKRIGLTPQQTALLVHLARAPRPLTAGDLIEAGLFRHNAATSTVHGSFLALRRRLDKLEPGLSRRLLAAGARGYSVNLALDGR